MLAVTMRLQSRRVHIFAGFSNKEKYVQNVIQVNDADMPLPSPALIGCQHFKLYCYYWSETFPVLILTEAYLQC